MMDAPFGVTTFLRIAYFICGVYIALLGAYALAMLVVAIRESVFRRRQHEVEDYDVVLGSRFTIPVSIIAPLYNEQEMAVPAVRAMLDQSYPEFEVVAVDDGSTDETLARLTDAFQLEPKQGVFPNLLKTQPLRMVYRSRTEPRLTVMTKDNGGKADAMNCGINVARYRYLCCVDGDTMFARDALLTAMTQIARDPGQTVGATSLFGISLEPEKSSTDGSGRPATNRHLLGDFQHLDMLRAFVAYRPAWSRLNSMLCVSGAYGLWRRDVIMEMGGFSREFSCEDIEMTFRVHDRYSREDRPYRILSLPSMVGHTEGPRRIRDLVSQRARWQRVILETLWHYRGMLVRREFGHVRSIGLPYYVLYEALAPLFHLLAVSAFVVAAVFGLLGWWTYLALFGMVAFATAIPTTLAVGLHDAAYRDYSVRDLLWLIALGPLDLLCYRPILMWAGVRGTWQFLRKNKGWNKFDRNPREPVPAAVVARQHGEPLRSATIALVMMCAAAASAPAQAPMAKAEDADALMARALVLRQQNRKAEAAASMDRAVQLAPNRADVRQYHDLIHYEVNGWEATLGADYKGWDDHRDPWREGQLALRRNTAMGPFVARVSHAERAGLSDDKLELEAYPAFPGGYVALGVGFAMDASLYPTTSYAGEVFKSLPGQLEGSLGYRRLNFPNPVDVATGSLGLYAGSFLIGTRVNHLFDYGTAVSLNVRRYLSDDGQYIGALATSGSVPAVIRSPDDFDTETSRSIGAEALFIVKSRWVVRGQATVGREDLRGFGSSTFSTVYLGLGYRF